MRSLYASLPARGMNTYVGVAGLTGVGLFAMGSYSSRALANLGLALFLLVALFNAGFWRYVWTSDVARAGLVFLLYALGLTLWTSHAYPDSHALQWEALKQWSALFLFLPLAWWLDGRVNRIEALLFLLLVGWLVNFALFVDWPRFLRYDIGIQMDFGFKAIPSGLIASVNVIGLLYLAERFCSVNRTLWVKAVLGGVWFFGLLASMYALGASQSRGIWVALLLVTPLLAGWFYIELQRRASGDKAPLAVVLALALLAGMIFMNQETVLGRVGQIPDQVTEVTSLEDGKAHVSSVGYRSHMLQFGLEKWAESPLIGWGPGASQWLLQQQAASENERYAAIHIFKHLHNNYLDFLLRFGIVGFLIMTWVVLLAMSGAKRKYRAGQLSSRLAFLLVTAFLLIGVAGMTNVYFFTWDSRVLGIILAAIAITRAQPAGT